MVKILLITLHMQMTFAVAANANVDPAVASVREMGYTDEIVQKAIDIMKRNNPGKCVLDNYHI